MVGGEQLLLHFAVAGWGCDACGEKGIRGKDRLDAVGEPILLETGLGGDLVKRYEDLVDRMIAERRAMLERSPGRSRTAWFHSFAQWALRLRR